MPATVLAACSFLAYGIAVRAFFARPDGVRPGMQLIQVLGLPASILHVLIVSRSDFAYNPVQTSALVLYGAGIGLFAWSFLTVRIRLQLPLAFSRAVPSGIMSEGPFGYMRHPFYTSYVLTWTAGALYTGNVWLLVIAVAFSIIYLVAIGLEERLLLAGSSGLEYASYRTRVGLIPFTSNARSWRQASSLFFFAMALVPGTALLLVLKLLTIRSSRLSARCRSLGVTWNAWACRRCLSIMNVGVRVEGLHSPGPSLFVSNHLSWLDVFVIGSQGRFIFVAADDYGKGLLGALLTSFGTIFLSRRSQEGLPRYTRQVREVLAAGYSVVLFPEGRTSDGSSVRPFHSSPFEAALEAGVPVVPVALEYDALGRADVRTDVCWVDGSLWWHMSNFLRRRSVVRATLHVAAPLQPWFTTRRKLADEAQRACALLLGVPVSVNAVETAPSTALEGPPLPPWFQELFGGLNSESPSDAVDFRNLSLETRLADSGLDSLAILALQEQLLSLGVRTAVPWSSEITFGQLIDSGVGRAAEASQAPGWEVRQARSDELQAAGELRYRIYVQELGRPFSAHGIASKALLDPLDESGQVLIAMGGTGLAATCRLNWGNDPLAYEAFASTLGLDLHARDHGLERIAIVSKLAIDPQFRANPELMALLLDGVVEAAKAQRCTLLVAHTRATLTTVFARAGFKAGGEPYFDSEWGGWQRPIVAALDEVRAFSHGGHPPRTLASALTCKPMASVNENRDPMPEIRHQSAGLTPNRPLSAPGLIGIMVAMLLVAALVTAGFVVFVEAIGGAYIAERAKMDQVEGLGK